MFTFFEDLAKSKYLNLGDDDDFYTAPASTSRRLINAQGGDDVVILNGTGDATVYGGSGADSLFGGDGRNLFYGGSGDDGLTGGRSDDTLYGGSGDDTIFGDNDGRFGLGNDTLYGGIGDDTLVGNWGADVLYGGADADTFKFRVFDESPVGAGDVIMDYDFAEGDRIDLSQLDANSTLQGNQEFQVSTSGATTQAGFMWVETVDADTRQVFLNLDGGAADMSFTVNFDAGVTSTAIMFVM